MFEGTASRTSTGLIRRAQANDQDAWTELVQAYSRRIYRWCRLAGLQPADASNVVQEVLRAVARKLSDFQHDRERATFRGWIRRITQNKIRDYGRQRSRQVGNADGGTAAQLRILELPDVDGAEQGDLEQGSPEQGSQEDRSQVDPSDAARGTHTQSTNGIDPKVVDQVRAEFSDRDWRFFWRVVVDGQSAVDVGHEHDVTANTVRLVKMRILRRFRELLITAQRPSES